MDNEDAIDNEKYFTLFEQFNKEKERESKEILSLNSKVLVVDFLNTFIRSWTASPAMNDDGEHIGGISGFLYSLGNAIRLIGATRCIIVSDGDGGSQRRRKIYPDYKMGRKAHMSDAKYLNRQYDFKSTQEESEMMKKQAVRLLQYLKQLPVQFISVDGVEADDVIAYLAMEVFNKPENKITIMSSDKDFLQLVDDRITVWSPTKKKLYTPDKILDEYGTSSQNFLLYRILDGDKSDNIPGVYGAGLKTMKKFLPMVSSSVAVAIDDVIKYAEEHNTGKVKKKFYTNLVESRDAMILNQKLMQLSAPSIAGQSKMRITRIVTEDKIPELNKYEIHVMYIHDKLSSAIPNINQWILNTFTLLNSFATKQNKEKPHGSI